MDKLLPSDLDAGDGLGVSVAINGDYAIIGTDGGNSAYVFLVTGNIPVVSTLGILVLAGLVLTAGGLVIGRHRRRPALQTGY